MSRTDWLRPNSGLSANPLDQYVNVGQALNQRNTCGYSNVAAQLKAYE
jgi:hypothetical protein